MSALNSESVSHAMWPYRRNKCYIFDQITKPVQKKDPDAVEDFNSQSTCPRPYWTRSTTGVRLRLPCWHLNFPEKRHSRGELLPKGWFLPIRKSTLLGAGIETWRVCVRHNPRPGMLVWVQHCIGDQMSNISGKENRFPWSSKTGRKMVKGFQKLKLCQDSHK